MTDNEPLVVDASVAVKWLVREEDSNLAAPLVRGRARLAAPDLLSVEVGNVLWKRARKGDMPLAMAIERHDALHGIDIEWHPSTPLIKAALAMAAELDHPIYDCLYLALAIRLDWRLMTADVGFRSKVAQRQDLALRVRLLGGD